MTFMITRLELANILATPCLGGTSLGIRTQANTLELFAFTDDGCEFALQKYGS